MKSMCADGFGSVIPNQVFEAAKRLPLVFTTSGGLLSLWLFRMMRAVQRDPTRTNAIRRAPARPAFTFTASMEIRHRGVARVDV